MSAVAAGAKGYLLKGAPLEEIFQAIRTVHAGGSLLQPIVTSKLMHHLSEQAAKSEDALELTPREIDVLRLAAEGMETAEIARQLCYSERTVKGVVHAITTRLRLRNRAQAVAYAVRLGLI